MQYGTDMCCKKRIVSFDFIRAFCAIGIIMFHFSCQLKEGTVFRPFYSFANGGWGEVFVGIFFVLSGAALYYNYSEIKSLKVFYYKRFKSIFPMFYLAFFAFYIWSVISTKNPFYGGNPLKLFISLIGLDGYLQYRMVNYYQVGEWFLGAVIILYVIYPFVLKFFKKSVFFFILICVLLYGLVFIPDFWTIPKSFNFFACLISFEFGMVMMKYYDKWNNNILIFLLSIVFSFLFIFVDIKFIPKDICSHLLPISLFVVLSNVGDCLMKFNGIKIVFTELSLLSYATFLVHHKVIYKITELFTVSDIWIEIMLLTLCVVLIILLAKGLFVINKLVLKSKLYQRIENRFINEK